MKNTDTNTVVTPTPKRGRPKTKMTLKRVVLLDGKPVGRGRPAADSKGNRTVVFIPIGETFDVTKHGTGSAFRPGLRQFKASVKRVDLKRFVAESKNNVAAPAAEAVA